MARRGGGSGLGAVLFTDIVGSTAIAAEMGNTRWSELVARHNRIVRHELGRFGGQEMDTAGDGFFATFERPADAIRCAVAAAAAVRELGIEIRAGVSFGELESIGKKASGLVVNTAARVMSVAGPGEVLVPASVREIVQGGGITFTEHGTHQLKGLDGEFRLFKVTEVDGAKPTPPLDVEVAAERRRDIFPTASRRRAILIGVGAGVLALIVTGVLIATGGEPEQPAGQAGPLQHAVAGIDPETGSILTVATLEGTTPPTIGVDLNQPIAAGEGSVWLLRPPLLLRVDPVDGKLREGGTDVTVFASAVTTGLDAAWVQIQDTIQRVHPGTGEAEDAVSLPTASGITSYSMAVSDAVWLGVTDGTLVRFDPGIGSRDQTDVGSRIDGLAATRDAVWVTDTNTELLTRLDPGTLRPSAEPIEVLGTNDRIAATPEAAWLLDRGVGVLTRVSSSTNAVNGTIRVGDDPTSLTVGLGFVWVGDGDGTLYRIDKTTLDRKEFEIGARVIGIAVDEAEETVWLYLGDSTAPGGA